MSESGDLEACTTDEQGVGRKPGQRAQPLGLMEKPRKPCGPTVLAMFSPSPSSPSLLPRALPGLKEKRTMTKSQVSRAASPFPTGLGTGNGDPCMLGKLSAAEPL